MKEGEGGAIRGRGRGHGASFSDLCVGLPGLRLPVLAIALPSMDGFFLQCTRILCAYFPEGKKKTNLALP